MSARKPLLTPDAAAFVKGEAQPSATSAVPPAPLTSPSAEPEARVRFTVDLPRSLHKRLKLAALNRDTAMTDLARQALTEWLDSQA